MKEAILAMLLSTGVNVDYEVRLMEIVVPVNMKGNMVDQLVYVPSVVTSDLNVAKPTISKINSPQ